MKKIGLIGMWALLIVAGCGPSVQQQRVCEMFADAGGGTVRSRDFWMKFYHEPDRMARMEADNRTGAEGARQRAEVTKRYNSVVGDLN